MNSTKTKLKPLNHKKSVKQEQSPMMKTQEKKMVSKKNPSVLRVQDEQGTGKYAKVKYVKSSNRPTTAIQLYHCDDMDDLGGLEDDGYLQKQLQKNIKVEQSSKKSSMPVPKSQIVLPKLEGDLKVKQIKDLEKEMDLQMSRILDQQF